jgi:predicted transposase YbfD/YdcC
MKNTCKQEKNQALFNCFISIQDPRVRGRCSYPLINILVIVLFSLICGCDNWKAMALFAKTRRRWLSQFIDLSNGLPSHLTIARIMALINPKEFEKCLEKWIKEVSELFENDIINIDGKTVRGSSHKEGDKRAIHLLNAYNARIGATLANQKVPDKSNEIKGIPILLNALDIKKKIITIDAMGTQKGIAKLIVKKQASYMLSLKKNHKRFYKKVTALFNKVDTAENTPEFIQCHEHSNYDHSRLEKRTYTILPAMYLAKYQTLWSNLTAYVRVESERQLSNGSIEKSTRFYITSIPYKSHHKMIESIRGHWSIENQLHWKLDVGMNEDKCPIFRGNAHQNLSTMRKIVLKLLHDDNSTDGGVAMKRIKAAMSTRYLRKLVGF